MLDIANEIIIKLGLDGTTPLKKAIRGLPGYTTYDLVNAIIKTSSIDEAAVLLGYSNNPIKQSIRQILSPLYPERHSKFGESSGRNPWRYKLLCEINYRNCWNCNNILPFSNFYKDSDDPLGISGECRTCHVHRTKQQKLSIIDSTPTWANIKKIRQIYSKCSADMHVDHIYPTNSDWVCGLNVENNLTYLSPFENISKGNRKNIKYHPDAWY